MDPSQEKIVQYLNEAHASERALTRVLQSQIAMTPRGGYRDALEQHLRETRDHAERVQKRLGRLREGRSPLQLGVGVAQSVAGQALAAAKTPLDLVRGTSGEEKVLKNAKDACATEALEIATYTSIEHLARAVGDDETAELAAAIRADEVRMLERVLGEIPALTAAVVGADVVDDDSRGTAPWPGYDQQSAEEVIGALADADGDQRAEVRRYERAHKQRKTVIEATEREPANA